MMRWNSSVQRPVLALLIVAGLVGASATALVLPAATATPATFAVGYSGAAAPAALLEGAGGRVLATSEALQFALVSTDDADGFLAALAGAKEIRYAQPDGLVHASAANWNGVNWNGANWNAANWNAANWNRVTEYATNWNAANWNAANWNAANWNAANWNGASATMDEGFPYQWGLGAIKADQAWNVTMGSSGVTVCVVDSGVDYTHPDLAPRMHRLPDGSFGYDFISGRADPMDDAGHGTHVAGIVAAQTGNGEGISGIAQARLIAMKVLDASGSGTESQVARGVARCADSGARVIVTALGTDIDAKVLADAVKYARTKDALIVAAAGNGGCKCPQYPAEYPGVIAVGAINPDRTLAAFSTTGTADGAYIDLVAPGVYIASTFLGGTYALGNGTSMAAPFVAGTAALVLAKDPSLSAAKLRDHLLKTAEDLGPKGRDAQYGTGLVDAHKALTAPIG